MCTYIHIYIYIHIHISVAILVQTAIFIAFIGADRSRPSGAAKPLLWKLTGTKAEKTEAGASQSSRAMKGPHSVRRPFSIPGALKKASTCVLLASLIFSGDRSMVYATESAYWEGLPSITFVSRGNRRHEFSDEDPTGFLNTLTTETNSTRRLKDCTGVLGGELQENFLAPDTVWWRSDILRTSDYSAFLEDSIEFAGTDDRWVYDKRDGGGYVWLQSAQIHRASFLWNKTLLSTNLTGEVPEDLVFEPYVTKVDIVTSVADFPDNNAFAEKIRPVMRAVGRIPRCLHASLETMDYLGGNEVASGGNNRITQHEDFLSGSESEVGNAAPGTERN